MSASAAGGGDRARSVVPLLVSLVVAALLLSAAVLKLIEWVQAADGAAGARATMGAEAEGPSVLKLLIPVSEAIIAAGVVVFHKRAWVWALAALMFGSLAGYVFLLMTRGAASCGCFGSYSPPPVVMFSVDTLMAVVCATLATRGWGFAGKRGLVLTLAGAGSLVGGAVANATTPPPADKDFDPLLALRELSVMAPALEVGRGAPVYLVYIYQKECPACQEHYPGMHLFEQATRQRPDIAGLLLEIGELETLAIEEGKELPKYSWEEVPVTLIMQNGQIRERFGRANPPSPRAVYERLTGESYQALLDSMPDGPGALPPIPGIAPEELDASGNEADATGAPAPEGPVDQAALVEKLRGMSRFGEIFRDEPGGVRHLMYAHTMCGSCLEYRKMLAELRDSGIVSDTLAFHLVTRDNLVDDGIAHAEWGGVHAALVFDGGRLVQWYGEGEVTENLPFELHDQFVQ